MFGFDTVLCYKKHNLSYDEQLSLLKEKLQKADAILVGAGAGLSTAAGLTYDGERFRKYFFDFAEKFGITDMYTGGFYPFPSPEFYWAWWSRQIYFNRYIDAPSSVYPDLLELVRDKNYFVLTTTISFREAALINSAFSIRRATTACCRACSPRCRKPTTIRKLSRRCSLRRALSKTSRASSKCRLRASSA